ncbi:MAG: HepT-like ribonuclease domain-containing protein [Desulfotignum sp.]
MESIEAIESYVSDIDNFEDFASDRKTYSATIREYIIIG